jgi:hypothetical protein
MLSLYAVTNFKSPTHPIANVTLSIVTLKMDMILLKTDFMPLGREGVMN